MIDDRGRLFGVLNLVDALLLVFVLGLVPLGYVAYRVFRVPPPRIERIEPASQPIGTDLRIRMLGHDLRPYIRVWLNRSGEPFSVSVVNLAANEARLLVETPSLAEARLPDSLTAGSYDIHMFDGTREIASVTNAFSLISPSSGLQVVVRFPVDEALVPLVRAGDRDVVSRGKRPPSDIGYAQLTSVRTLDKAVTAFAFQAGRVGVALPARMLEATLALPAAKSTGGVWEYRREPIRAGDPLVFETPRYTMYGFIVDVRTVENGAAARAGAPSR